ncbi:MAG: lipase family protein [Actinomycetota bacterium]|nr:lipase family protein [Actinomycetota bacterium]
MPVSREGDGQRGRGARRWLRIALIGVGGLIALVVGVAVVLVSSSGSPKPGRFYALPSPLPPGPDGTVIRSEPVADPPAGARAWKILYLSRSYTGQPTAVSGLLFVPTSAGPAGGRDVVAFTHGTTGVDSSCAPSNIGPSYWPAIDGLSRFLKAGDVVVAPDYQGLGTAGPHPYLVGRAEAAATLDGVRAAHLFVPARASTRFVVWGASQGGQAALFTGQEASAYAPELRLRGVAAAAPATNLPQLLEANRDTQFGRILSAYTIDAWSQVYPQLHFDDIVTRGARPIVRRLSKICLTEKKGFLGVGVLQLALKISYLRKLPWETEPWKGLIAQNTPGHARIPAPIFITQGDRDALVGPAINAAFARQLCGQRERVEYRTYPGVMHIDAGPKTAADVAAWIAQRFAGKAAPTNCANP